MTIDHPVQIIQTTTTKHPSGHHDLKYILVIRYHQSRLFYLGKLSLPENPTQGVQKQYQ